jgi:hypothetical protein
MKNELNITTSTEINIQNLKIEFEVKYSTPKILIYKGGTINDVPNDYGINIWTISYLDRKVSLIGEFAHLKTNRNDNHTYNFKVHKVNDSVVVDISINGENRLNERLQLRPTSIILK